MRMLLLLLISLPLYSAPFASNALGQDLGPIDALTGSGYEGESADGRTLIYLDGEIIKERESLSDGYIIREGEREERVIAENGRRVSRTITEPGRIEEYRYTYEDDVLSSVTYSVNGEIESITDYIETPSGTLAGISGTEENYFTPEYLVYVRDGNVLRAYYAPRDAEIPEGYTQREDGSWIGTYTSAGETIERVYSQDGLLLSEKREGREDIYSYDENGTLIQDEVIEGDTRMVIWYEDGRPTRSERYYQDRIIADRVYREDDRISETRYRDGEPYARILFDRDGLRVLEVENLR